jgi:hypothetical protein
VVKDRLEVQRKSLYFVPDERLVRQAVPTLINAYHAITLRQATHLPIPYPVIQSETCDENNRWPGPEVLNIQSDVLVDVDMNHGAQYSRQRHQ